MQLHALQEVWNMCQDVFCPDDEVQSDTTTLDSGPSQLFSLLSAVAYFGTPSNKTM
jgi:hypothetical protein